MCDLNQRVKDYKDEKARDGDRGKVVEISVEKLEELAKHPGVHRISLDAPIKNHQAVSALAVAK